MEISKVKLHKNDFFNIAEREILKRLTLNGSTTYTQLLNADPPICSNKTLINSLKHLLFLRLLKTSKLSTDKGRKPTQYSLTVEGLILGLITCLSDDEKDENIKVMDKVSDKYNYFPLIISQWGFFKKQRVTDQFFKRLEITLSSEALRLRAHIENLQEIYECARAQPDLFTDIQRWERWVKNFVRQLHELTGGKIPLQHANDVLRAARNIDRSLGESVIEYVTKRFFFPFEVSVKEQTVFLSKACKKKEIKTYVLGLLNEMEEDAKQALQNIRVWRQLLSKDKL